MGVKAGTIKNNAKSIQNDNKNKPTIFKRLLWIVLVGVIPLVVTIALIGTALQFIGFPVLQTAKGVLGLSNQNTVSSPIDKAKQDLATETAKERLDSSQILTLRQQVATDEQQIAQLTSQLNALQSKAAGQASLLDQAKKEAQVLSQMDPGQAANVLTKMQPPEAAATVAALSPADSGGILSQMDPKVASALLSSAAELETTVNQQSSNSTNNSTTGQ